MGIFVLSSFSYKFLLQFVFRLTLSTSHWMIIIVLLLTLLLGRGKFFDKILDCSAVVSLFLASIVFDAEILASALVSISSSSNKYNEVKYFLKQHISYAVVDFSAICWQKGQTLSISVGS